jgi:hypothetical protein
MAKEGDVANFRTIGGNTVTFVYKARFSGIYGEMTCNGCKTSDSHCKVSEANQHAGQCRAQ